MESKNYLKDISEIKDIMNKSSRFISLSGLSGILAGIYALVGASVTYWLVATYSNESLNPDSWIFKTVLLILFIVAGLSILTSVLLTTRKAKKNGEKIWDTSSRRLVLNFLIPLVTGGLYILIILNEQNFGQAGALMLIFYGLALVNASKFSIGDIQYLGYIFIILGLICALFPEYGFWLWVVGFGFMHIAYGIMMSLRDERKHV